MIKLKPCPFCGGEAEMDALVACGEDGTKYVISCPKCEISVSSYLEDNAYNIWNTRADGWHTGEPTEEGYYLVHLKKYYYKDTVGYIVAKWERNWWRTINIGSYWNLGEEIDAWQRIEPYREKEE